MRRLLVLALALPAVALGSDITGEAVLAELKAARCVASSAPVDSDEYREAASRVQHLTDQAHRVHETMVSDVDAFIAFQERFDAALQARDCAARPSLRHEYADALARFAKEMCKITDRERSNLARMLTMGPLEDLRQELDRKRVELERRGRDDAALDLEQELAAIYRGERC